MAALFGPNRISPHCNPNLRPVNTKSAHIGDTCFDRLLNRQQQNPDAHLWKKRNREKTRDWLAVDAVSCELFSDSNSLSTGKNTGNITHSAAPF
jgi:hypothetical protein